MQDDSEDRSPGKGRPRAEAQPILVDPLRGVPSLRRSDAEATSGGHLGALGSAEPANDGESPSGDDRPAMTGPRVRQDSFVPFLTIALPPALAGLVGLAAGWLAWPGLVLVVLAGLLASLALLRRHRAHVAELVGFVSRAGSAPDAPLGEPPAPMGSLLTGELTGSIVEVLREAQRRRQVLSGLDAGKEAVLAALPYPLLTLTSSRRVTRANQAARDLLDGPLEGRDLISVLREPALLAGAEAVLAGAEGRTVEFAIEGGLSRHFVAQVQRLPPNQPDGTVAILALQDVTALKRAEQLRADFVANASHELKTPLASLMGFIETLDGAARDDPEARARFLPIMQEQARRMAHLVEDLLSLSRIELHEHTPPDGRADLVVLLKRVVAALSLKAEERSIRMVVKADTLPLAQGDPDELEQVFQNLVDNAIKYGRPQGMVTVEARLMAPEEARLSGQGHHGLAVSVVDQGEGIAREHIPRLTERFYRVDTARSRALGGTGLGLAIVKHIVNRHRGRLEIRSELGQGSTFTVYLRAAASQRRTPEEAVDWGRPKAVGE